MIKGDPGVRNAPKSRARGGTKTIRTAPYVARPASGYSERSMAKKKTSDPYPHWQHWPKNAPPHPTAVQIVECFAKHESHLDSRKRSGNENRLKSNDVLAHLVDCLKAIDGMQVEEVVDGKIKRIPRPVLYAEFGRVRKTYEPDGFHPGLSEGAGLVMEIEAGMTVPNNVAYKDLIKACMMEGTEHFLLAVPLWYDGGGRKENPYVQVSKVFSTIYESTRLDLPLETVTLLGY